MVKSNKAYFGRTEKLGFNPLSDEDIKLNYYENFYDPNLNIYTKHSKIPPGKRSSTRLLDESDDGNAFRFTVTRLDTKTKIGVCSLQDVDFLNRSGHIARFLWDKNISGMGLGTEVLRFLTGFAFDKINLNKVIVRNVSTNIAAEKSCLKAGFTLEGKLRQEFYANGKYLDVNYFGMLREQFYSKGLTTDKND